MGHVLTQYECRKINEVGRYSDSEITDLYMRVGKTKKTFHFRFKCPITGKRREMVLGKIEQFTRGQIKKLVNQFQYQLSMGELPGKAKVKARMGKTVGAVFEKVFKRLDRDMLDQISRGQQIKPASTTISNYKRVAKREFGPLNDKLVDELERSEVADWYNALLDTGKTTKANVALDVFRALGRHAVKFGIIDEFNCARDIYQPHYQPKGARHLEGDELRSLWQYTEDLEATPKNAIRLQILTCTRMREVVQARWDGIDLEAGVWETTTKNHQDPKRPLAIALSDEAIKLLKEQRLANMATIQTRNSEYVFPASKHARRKLYWDNMDAVLKSIAKREGMAPMSSHSLRKGVYTLISNFDYDFKASTKIVSLVAGHVVGKIRGIYDKNFYMEKKRIVVNKLAEYVAGRPDNGGNVVKIRGSKK